MIKAILRKDSLMKEKHKLILSHPLHLSLMRLLMKKIKPMEINRILLLLMKRKSIQLKRMLLLLMNRMLLLIRD